MSDGGSHIDLHMINKFVLWSYPMIIGETIILVESIRVIPAELRIYRRAWKRRRFNAAEILLLLIKYFAIVGWSLDAVVRDSDWPKTGQQCEVIHSFAFLFTYLPVTFVALAIAWRTYIIFQCNRKVLAALAIAVSMQLTLSMWTAFTQYRTSVLIQGFCNPLPKAPIPKWKHSSPWFLLYNFLYDGLVSGFSTWRLIKSTGGPRGVSHISRVLFYNNVHYMLIVCSCNFAEYVAMQTSRENMPSLLPISMAIQVITAMNMLISEQDLVHGHGHGTARSNVTPSSGDGTNRKGRGGGGGIFSSKLSPQQATQSSGWNVHSGRGDATTYMSKGTYGSTSKVTDEGPPFHGISYEQSKLCSLEDGIDRRGGVIECVQVARRNTDTSSEHTIGGLTPDGKSGNALAWSPAATTVVGEQTFIMTGTPKKGLGGGGSFSATLPTATVCTCGLGQPLRTAAESAVPRSEGNQASPGGGGIPTVPRKGTSIRDIRQHLEDRQATLADSSQKQAPAATTNPSFEIRKGSHGLLTALKTIQPAPELDGSSVHSSTSSPPSTPLRAYTLHKATSTNSLRRFGSAASLVVEQPIAAPVLTSAIPSHQKDAASVDATNAGVAAASAMARLTASNSRQSTPTQQSRQELAATLTGAPVPTLDFTDDNAQEHVSEDWRHGGSSSSADGVVSSSNAGGVYHPGSLGSSANGRARNKSCAEITSGNGNAAGRDTQGTMRRPAPLDISRCR